MCFRRSIELKKFIFICYASDDKSEAEKIYTKLNATEKYKIYFYEYTSSRKETNDEQIKKAINSADLFIFLISSHSLELRYTQVELELAKNKWPNSAGHVLPVRISKVEYEKIPGYLKEIPVIELEEVKEKAIRIVHEVEELFSHKKKDFLRRLLTWLLIIFVIFVISFSISCFMENEKLGKDIIKNKNRITNLSLSKKNLEKDIERLNERIEENIKIRLSMGEKSFIDAYYDKRFGNIEFNLGNYSVLNFRHPALNLASPERDTTGSDTNETHAVCC